jgi:hypothetical protein
MSFRDYFLGLDSDQRAAYAERSGSTVGYLLQIAYGNKQVELGLADVLVAQAGGHLDLNGLPLTERALDQHLRRQRAKPAPEPQAQ